MLVPNCPRHCGGELYFSSSSGRWKCDSCSYVGDKTLEVGTRTERTDRVLNGRGRKVMHMAKKAKKAKKGKYTMHKAYSYKNKKGKTVHVAAHREKRR